MGRKNIMKRYSASLVLMIFIGCSGPLETQLNESYETYEKLTSESTENQEKYMQLLEKNVPLLSEKSYKEKRDIKNKKEIMYRASVLLAAIAFRLEEGKEVRESARNIYMNAYLLNSENAYKDFIKLLPKESVTNDFKNIKVPEYKSENSFSEVQNQNSNQKTDLQLYSKVSVSKDVPLYLYQIIGGDILYRAKEEKKDLTSLRIEFFSEEKFIGHAQWDIDTDELSVMIKK